MELGVYLIYPIRILNLVPAIFTTHSPPLIDGDEFDSLFVSK